VDGVGKFNTKVVYCRADSWVFEEEQGDGPAALTDVWRVGSGDEGCCELVVGTYGSGSVCPVPAGSKDGVRGVDVVDTRLCASVV